MHCCSYYLWRDQGIAEARSLNAAANPCYLNRQEPLELAFGWGKVRTHTPTSVYAVLCESVNCHSPLFLYPAQALEQVLRAVLKKRGLPDTDIDPAVVSMLADCLAPPLMEFKFPRDL